VVAVRTVDTHVSNVLAKLGVSSRSAATSLAYRRHLV
jgi:DNA-binding NarL/FixJ family response regulator